MAWLTGWGRRKSLVINQIAGAEANYPVPIKIYKGSGTDGTEARGSFTIGKGYCGGNCRDDFGDIRFTEDDGSTEIPYWLETGTLVSGTSVIIWVKITGNLTDGNVTIYMYYDKADATTTSNGDNVFSFFDDFPDTSIDSSKWTEYLAPTITVADSVVLITDVAGIRGTSTFGIGFASMTLARYKSGTYGWLGGFANYNIDLINFVLSFSDAGKYIIGTLKNGTTGENQYNGDQDLNWHNFEAARISTTSVKGFVDFSLISTGIINENAIPTVALPPNHYTSASPHIIEIDWHAIRKRVDPDPTFGAWGSEETPPVAKIASGGFSPILKALDII